MSIFTNFFNTVTHLTKGYSLLLLLVWSISAKAQNAPIPFCAALPPSADLLQQVREFAQRDTRSGTILYVPTVLHIVGRNDGTGYVTPSFYLDAFCQLNKDFAPSDIQFYLADSIHYIQNSAWYEHDDYDGGTDMHTNSQVPNALNCYVVEKAAGACAYAAPGWCIVLKNSCTGVPNHTWAHEAGHYFSLPHTFYGWEGEGVNTTVAAPATINGSEVEKLDGSNCTTAGDFICDTPPDYISNRWTCSNGKSGNILDPNGQTFQVDGGYYMSYSNDACMNKFSLGQTNQMRGFALSSLGSFVSPTPPALQPTGLVTNISPAPNDTITTPYAAQLTWTRDPNATYYIIEVSLQLNFLTTSISRIATDTTYLLTGLQPNKRYNWRVRSYNEMYTCSPTTLTPTRFWTAKIVSTQNTLADTDLMISPNPIAQGQPLQLKWSNINANQATLKVSDLAGRVLQQSTLLPMQQDQTEIDTALLTAGVYMVSLQTETGIVQTKIVVY